MERRQFVWGTVGVIGGAAAMGLFSQRDRSAGETPEGPAPEPRVRVGRTSYAAMGEDLILGSLLKDVLKIASPTYLDIGAADPIAASNTYLLYTEGSRGVLVEPNPTYVERLKAVRPGDTVLGVGIGAGEAREADYYVIKGQPMLNSFSPETVEFRRKNGYEVERVVKMPLVPVMTVIDEHFKAAPDLLSIDAEGFDLDIAKSMDLTRYRPAVVCAETKGPKATHESTPLAQYLMGHGYLVTAGTIYNTILVDRARL